MFVLCLRPLPDAEKFEIFALFSRRTFNVQQPPSFQVRSAFHSNAGIFFIRYAFLVLVSSSDDTDNFIGRFLSIENSRFLLSSTRLAVYAFL